MDQTLTTEQLRAFTEQLRALDDDDLSNLAWRMYCEQQDRLNHRRQQVRPLGIALNVVIAGLLYAYFGNTPAFGWAIGAMFFLGVVVDHLINWYSPQYLLARAEYLTLERERKALVRQFRREEAAQRRARLKRWLSGRL